MVFSFVVIKKFEEQFCYPNHCCNNGNGDHDCLDSE